MRLVNRVLPDDVKLFAPEGSAEGCASGECLPEATTSTAPPAPAASTASVSTTSTPRPSVPTFERSDEDELEAAPAPAPKPAPDDAQWRRAVDQLRDASPRHGKSLSYARFLGFSPEGVRIAFPQDAAFHRAQVTGMSRAMVEAELSKSLKRPIKLIEDTNAQALQAAPKSIAEVEASDRSSRERQIEAKVRTHPALRNVLKHLGGGLEHISYLDAPAGPAKVATDAPPEGDERGGLD